MVDMIAGWLRSLPTYSYLGILVLLLALLLLRSRRSSSDRLWRPLIPLVHGTVKNQRKRSALVGSYRGHPVLAMIGNGGADTTEMFTVQISTGPGGRDWEIAHSSEKLLGPEMWRVSTKDPALQSRLQAANVAPVLQAWSGGTVVNYDAGQGVLTLREELGRPSAEHFRKDLELLEWLAEVNREVNG